MNIFISSKKKSWGVREHHLVSSEIGLNRPNTLSAKDFISDSWPKHASEIRPISVTSDTPRT